MTFLANIFMVHCSLIILKKPSVPYLSPMSFLIIEDMFSIAEIQIIEPVLWCSSRWKLMLETLPFILEHGLHSQPHCFWSSSLLAFLEKQGKMDSNTVSLPPTWAPGLGWTHLIIELCRKWSSRWEILPSFDYLSIILFPKRNSNHGFGPWKSYHGITIAGLL